MYKYNNPEECVGFEVFTPVVMNSSVFKKLTEADSKMTSACAYFCWCRSAYFSTLKLEAVSSSEKSGSLRTVTTQKDCILHYCPLSRRQMFCLYYCTSTIIN
jgi:hypothetical protein